MKLSNSPQELTVLRLEARKSFSFNVSISDGRGLMMDLTDCVVTIDWLNKLIAPREPDTTDFTTVTGEIDDPASGVIRFDIQASQLMLKPGSYPFAITLISLTGYSVVLVKGEIQLLENTEFESSEYTYPDGDPLPGIDVVLRDKQVIEVNLDTFIPPAQGPEGPAGPEGPRGPKGEKGDTGDQGPPGEKGDKGDQGIQGVKGDTGNTGSPGATGPANVLNIGTVTTVTPGQPATASITGTTPAQTLNLGIPSGLQGAPGVKGDKGDTGAQGPPAVFANATEIPNAVDLNTYTAPGVYAQSTDAEAATGTNYPVPLGGQLQVTRNAATDIVWQQYTVSNQSSSSIYANKVFTRGLYSGSWSAWTTVSPRVFGWAISSMPSMANNVITTVTNMALDASSTGVTLVSNALVAPIAGLYQVNSILTFNFASSGGRSTFIRRNGAIMLRSVGCVSTTTTNSVTSSLVLSLAAGDTVDFQGYQSSSVNPLTLDTGSNGCSFSIARIA